MKLIFFIIVFLMSLSATQAVAAPSHFAGPTVQGNGNCLSRANQCLVSTALNLASLTGGSELELIGNTMANPTVYTGTSGMIRPPSGKSGSNGNPITIRASCDGCVLLENTSSSLAAIDLNNNHWFEIEGFVLKNTNTGDGVHIHNGSKNNIIRRVSSWGIHTVDGGAMGVHGTVVGAPGDGNNLLEDVAVIAHNRKLFSDSQRGDGTVFRRFFGLQLGSLSDGGPKGGQETGYRVYNSVHEDGIMMWDETVSPIPGVISGHFAIGPGFDTANGDVVQTYCANVKVVGMMGIIRSAFVSNQLRMMGLTSQLDCGLAKDIFFYKEGHVNHPRAFTASGWAPNPDVFPSQTTCPVCQRFAHDITRVGTWNVADEDTGGSTNKWQFSNYQTFSSASAAISGGAQPLQATPGPGARFCKRHNKGVETNDGLFLSNGEWPMGQRINAMMNLMGLDTTRYFGAGNEVGGYMASVFGPIPSECLFTTESVPPVEDALVLEISCDNTIADSSGQDNNGTLQNGAGFTIGKYNEGCFFDGVDDFITIPDSDSLDFTTGFTISMWAKPVAISDTLQIGLAKSNNYFLYLSSEFPVTCPDGVYGGFVDTAARTLCWGTPLSAGIFTHVALTYDEAIQTLNLYINGSLVTSQVVSGTMVPNISPLTIGDFSGRHFDGVIDEIRLYNYPQIQAEIVVDMNTSIEAVQISPFLQVAAGSASWKLGAGSSAWKTQGSLGGGGDPVEGLIVDPSGSGVLCTDASPCTLMEGLSQAVGGEEVVLNDGVYDEQQIKTVRSGSSGSPITIRARNFHGAIIQKSGSYGSQNQRVCTILHSYIVLKDVVCDGKGEQSVFGIDGTDGNIITDIVVEGIWARNGHGTHWGWAKNISVSWSVLEDFAGCNGGAGCEGEWFYIANSTGTVDDCFANPITKCVYDVEWFANRVTKGPWEVGPDFHANAKNWNIHHNIFEDSNRTIPKCVTGCPGGYAGSMMNMHGTANTISDNIFRKGGNATTPMTKAMTINRRGHTVDGNVFYDFINTGGGALGNNHPSTDDDAGFTSTFTNNTFCSANAYGYVNTVQALIDAGTVIVSNNPGLNSGGRPQSECDAEVTRILDEMDALPGYTAARFAKVTEND